MYIKCNIITIEIS